MCHERYWRRRRREEADESREIWADFDRARLIADLEQPQEVTEPGRTELREEISTAER
jgi:hypothetical protein